MTVQSVQRALDILAHFSLSRTSLGIVELSELTGITKGAVHSLVKTLESNGFLRQDPATRRYRLGFKVYELGAILESTLEINQIASEAVHALANKTKLAVRIAIWDGDSVLFTIGASGSTLPLFKNFGPRLPAYCSAHGRAMLAHLEKDHLSDYLERTELIPYTASTTTKRKKLLQELEKIHKHGYAHECEELLLGIEALAAPILGRNGILEAAMSIAGSPKFFRGESKNRLANELLKTAMLVSRQLGYIPEEKAF